MKSLVVLFLPLIAICLGIAVVWNLSRFSWLHNPSVYPWEFWFGSSCALVAAAAGVADWVYHRRGHRIVGAKERQYEFMALAGGVPLFSCMAIASLIEHPLVLLIPTLVVVLYMTVLICYDEFIFHRHCKRLETVFHRLLVFGNGLAWLAWAHWCFVRGGSYV